MGARVTEGLGKVCPVSIGQRRYFALVDTGADISLMSKQLLGSLPRKHITHRTKTNHVLQGVTGKLLSTLGTATIKLRVGRQNITHQFIIGSALSKPMILGLDLLTQHRARIDCGDKTLSIGNSVVLLQDKSVMKDNSHSSCDLVKVTEYTRLPAQSLTYVNVTMPKCHPKSMHVIASLDTCPPFQHQVDVSMPEIVTNDKVSQLIIINKSPRDVNLKRHQVIATVEEVPELEVMEITVPECDKTLTIPGFDNLSPRHQNSTKRLIDEYKDLFVQSDLELGRTDRVSMKIETGDHPPIRQRPYRTPWSQKSLVEEHIGSMLEADVIKESASPWASPIVMVPKKDGTKRFCVDYRKLNRVIKQNSYPLPNIDDILTSMHQSTVFSCLDLKSGYWQIPLDPDSQEKTAFICHAGLYHFNVVPFGISIAPPVFQELMDKVLIGIRGKFTTAYLDDIIIYSRTVEEHLEHMNEVFKRLADAGLKLKLSKCELFKSKIAYLGHEVSAKGIEPSPTKVEVIKNLQAPTNVREVRSFVGLASYYRRFISNFSEIVRPLTALTKKHANFCWDDVKQHAFDELKSKLIVAPILAYPQTDQPYHLYTDASLYAVGAVLTQMFPEGERVIEYVSRQLTEGQQKWPTIEREAYAIISSIGKLRHYLVGSKFTIYTDHKPLRSLFTADMRNPRVQRWAIILEEYNCDVQYTTGKNNVNADMLSRIKGEPSLTDDVDLIDSSVPMGKERLQAVLDENAPADKEDDITDEDLNSDEEFEKEELQQPKVLPPVIEEIPDLRSLKDISVAQKRDPKLHAIINNLTANPVNEAEYHMEDDVLYHVSKPVRFDQTQRLQLVIPDCFADQLIKITHEEAGHAGLDKTYDRIRTRYFWDNMYKNVATYLSRCDICIRRQKKKVRAPMQHMPMPDFAFEIIGIDTCGPFPQTHNGNQYIVTIVDHLTSWPEIYAVPNKTANAVAKLLLEHFIPRHGCPKYILSDNGTEYCNSVISLITQKLKIGHLRTSPYHAQTNGKTERFHRYLNDALAKYINRDFRNWDTYIPSVAMAYRTSVNETTRHTPFFLVYGRDPILPMDTLLNPKFKYHGDDYVPTMLQRLHVAFDDVRENMIEVRQKNKRNYDKRAEDRQFEPGDAVYMYDTTIKQGDSSKLTSPWKPFYRIIEKTSPVNYRVKSQQTGKSKIIHVNMLKAAHPDDTWDQERDTVEPVVTYKEEDTLRQQPLRLAKLATGYSAGGRRLIEAARTTTTPVQPNVQLNVHPDVRTREATHARVDHQNTSRIKQSRSRDSDSDEDNIPLAVLAKKLRADDDPSTSDDHSHARYPPMMVRPQKRERDTSPEDTTSKRFAREGTSHAKISTTPMEVSAIDLSDNHGCEGVAESHSMDVPELTAGASKILIELWRLKILIELWRLKKILIELWRLKKMMELS